MREAIAHASQAGQGLEVAGLRNNLGVGLWTFEGPAASLEVLREGIAFAQARGLAELVNVLTSSTLDPLVDTGELDEALEVADDIVERLEASGEAWTLIEVHAAQAWILALRGQAGQTAESLDWLESTSRGSGNAQDAVFGLGSSALARAGLGQDDQATALLGDVQAIPRARENPYYAAFLPVMVRTALGIGDRELAGRLVDGLEPRYPRAEHALVAANAALAEARGDFQAAADAYTDSAERWERFGVVTEQAFALLGQARCLLRLSRPTEAGPVLRGAREIFARLQAAPALAETDALLGQATALSS
jgi:hypothetical protein